MSGLSGIWKELGIEPTDDKKKIKRAYAKQAARYHPEEYPEKFQRVHQAYEIALKLSEAGNGKEPFSMEHCLENGIVETSFTEGSKINSQESEDISDREKIKLWEQGERISELTGKYAKENEHKRIRRILYEHFLIGFVFEKLDLIIVSDKHHYRKCRECLKDPIVLEAIHCEDFQGRFERWICKRSFRPKSVRLLRKVLMKELPEDYAWEQKLQSILRDVEKDSRKRRRIIWIKRVAFTVTLFVAVLLLRMCGI